MLCSRCQEDNPPSARFCMHCGAALPLLCLNCGTEHPPEARFCMRCGQPLAEETSALTPPPAGASTDEATGALIGERRVITAMFADVKGSTALAERIDVETWVEIMNHVLQMLSVEIHRYGGEIDRYEGDGLVAFFGLSTAHEDDAERAVLAALAMQDAVHRYAAELAKDEAGDAAVDLLLRIGLNTGQVITGHVGEARQHGEDTAMGRAIAVAARLEPAAEPGTVLVSEDTYRLVASAFEWATVGQISAKGFADPLPVYRPLAHRPTVDKGRGIEGLESPLVGRSAERQALQDAVQHLRREGSGSIVTLVGEAGIGKSRLVAEIREGVGTLRPLQGASDEAPLHRERPLQWVEGRCLSYATGVAYSLWLDLLRGLLDVAPDASPIVVRDALREWLYALCPDCLDEVYPFLGRLLSLPVEEQAEARLSGIEAEGLKVLTFRAVETLVRRAAGRQPLVIVCEDLHWADATSLALLEHLLPLADLVPLLVLCVLRPEREHGCWQIRETVARLYPHRHLDLWLEPLSAAESQELVRNLLRIEDLPQALRERIIERTEGNPFFLEEILRSLIDGGIVAYDEVTGRWHATQDVADIPIPDTLQSVLRARIDCLPAEARRVLQLASVIGRIFSDRVLASIAEEEDLDRHLVALQRAQMVRERTRVPEATYIFKHQLTLEAAYSGLLKRERHVIHRHVAEALETLYSEHVGEQLGLLAYHWEQAGEMERAVEYLQRAGEQAASQYANQEAVSYFSRALDLVPDAELDARYALLLARERVHNLHGDREAQKRDLAALKAIVPALDDDQRSAEIALREANYALWVTADRDSSVAAAKRAIRHARAAEDVASEAEGHLLWGKTLRYFEQGTVSDRISKFEEALRLSRAAHSPTIEADSLRELGLLSNDEDDCSAAMVYLDRCLQVHRETGNRMEEGRALNALGFVGVSQGDLATARDYCEQGLQLCRETGNRFDEAWALLQLGWAAMREADYTAARTYHEQSLRIFRDVGNWHGEAGELFFLGTVHDALGDYGQAMAYYEQALDTGRTASWGLAGLGLLYHHLGEDEAARERCQQAIDIRQSRGRRPSASVLTSLGHALTGLDRLDLAIDAYRQAVRLRRETGEHSLAVEPLAGLARVALAREERAGALAYVEEILSCLEVHPKLEGTREPLRVYLTCYQVLRANEDPRAKKVLGNAYHLLQERATRIEDAELRRSYLLNVAAHREIVNEFTKGS